MNSEIVGKDHMDIKLVTGEMAHTIRKVIRNPEALEYYYRGWQALFGSTKDEIKDNLDAFLILAGANAALDRQEQAAKAATEIKRIKPGFSLKKYAQTQPYKDARILEQITSMLQKAGLH